MNGIDPSGLLFDGAINAGEGYGQGATEYYADVLTDPDAAWYEKAGAAVGGFFSALWTPCTSDSTFAVLSTAAGGAGGWRAAGSKVAGKEFSHWIPDRALKKTGSNWVRNTLGTSKFNGNYVYRPRHFMHDPHRFLKGTKKGMKTWSKFMQQADRVPCVYYGWAEARVPRQIWVHPAAVPRRARWPYARVPLSRAIRSIRLIRSRSSSIPTTTATTWCLAHGKAA